MTTKRTTLFEQQRIKELRVTLNLQKIGINYFCKCPFCNDPGQHFCIPAGAKRYVCYNCPKHGETDELIKTVKNVIPETQTVIL